MTNQHIIKKQFVEVIANGVGDSFSLQKEVEDLCKLKLIPQLSLLLDKYGNTDEVIQIDKLFIKVDNISLSDFDQLFVEKVLHEIEDALRETTKASTARTTQQSSTIRKREIELFVFYLRHGYLPWWSTVKNGTEWQQKLNFLLAPENREVEWSMLRVAVKEAVVRERLLSELSEEQFWNFVDRLLPMGYKTLKVDFITLDQDIRPKQSQTTFKNLVLKSIAHNQDLIPSQLTIAKYLAEEIKNEHLSFKVSKELVEKITNKELQIMLIQFAERDNVTDSNKADKKITKLQKKDVLNSVSQSDNNKPSVLGKETNDLKSPTSSKGYTLPEEIYIGDSGLIIIAPYLPMFFKNLELLDNNQIKDIPMALGLLHYITYGNDDYAGFECVLAKVLCGVDLGAVIRKVAISESDKTAADELLMAVIAHWQALKNTSPTALQTSFLQREGRLSFENNEWNLKVHNESYDLLLSHIPWNINMIKSPWMNHLLKVEWM